MEKQAPKILVIDDDPISCKIATAMLKRLGYTVHNFTSVCDARQALYDHQFDLVLLDWVMPTIGGAEMTTLIRSGKAGEHQRNIPIIAVSASVPCSHLSLFLSAGVTDYIEKPISLKVLQEKVSALILPASGQLLQEHTA
jgi:CheY-like chemotaxis protein